MVGTDRPVLQQDVRRLDVPVRSREVADAVVVRQKRCLVVVGDPDRAADCKRAVEIEVIRGDAQTAGDGGGLPGDDVQRDGGRFRVLVDLLPSV